MFFPIVIYFTGVGLILLKKHLKKKRFGKIIDIGKLTNKKVPIGPLIEFIFLSIYNICFILTAKNMSNLLLNIFIIFTIVSSIGSIIKIFKDRKIIYIYEKGIEFNAWEIQKNEIKDYLEIEPNKYRIITDQKQIIEFELDKTIKEY
jgi:hypothetical protein